MSQAAVEPPQTDQEQQQAQPEVKPGTQANPKKLPPYRVVVLNDDDHTFNYVIEVLQLVCRVELVKAIELTLRVHHHGRAAVWTGPKEVAELKRDQIRSFGPDVYASQAVRYALGVVLEPVEDS